MESTYDLHANNKIVFYEWTLTDIDNVLNGNPLMAEHPDDKP